MIDFRYHLVSIASVFLALAVGIVLGAGPLKGTIGDTLTSEVTRLRDDANALRSELSSAEGQVAARDQVITALHPLVVQDLLVGESVSVLVLPGASDTSVEAAATALADAGADVPTTVRLDPAWVSADPPDEAIRTAAAGNLRQHFATGVPVGAPSEEVIGVALGWALGRPPLPGPADLPPGEPIGPNGTSEPTVGATGADDPADPGEDAVAEGTGDAGDEAEADSTTDEETDIDAPTGSERRLLAQLDERSVLILDILASHGLLSHDTSTALGRGTSVVVVAPETADLTEADRAGWAQLLTALEDIERIAVVGAVDREATAETQLMLTIREDGDLSGAVSTLDNIDTPVGTTALPLMLVDTEDAGSGHYGQLDSAVGLLPPLPTDTP